ncbi:MAG: 50S ribosomal protein L18 [Bacteroidales bacterium]|jgi:large subunit ribosomal protein L18|nr:50S ribosomal protein L18 [Bacteroidales bacterium]
MAITKFNRRLRIKQRVRKIVEGTAERPRMSVYRSNKGMYVQMIDDKAGKTLVSLASNNKEIEPLCKGKTKIEQAAIVGETVAKKSIEKGIESVVFDRNGYLYHGRVKSLADSARKGGLKF